MSEPSEEPAEDRHDNVGCGVGCLGVLVVLVLGILAGRMLAKHDRPYAYRPDGAAMLLGFVAVAGILAVAAGYGKVRTRWLIAVMVPMIVLVLLLSSWTGRRYERAIVVECDSRQPQNEFCGQTAADLVPRLWLGFGGFYVVVIMTVLFARRRALRAYRH